MGRTDGALRWLREAVQEPSFAEVVQADPLFAPLAARLREPVRTEANPVYS